MSEPTSKTLPAAMLAALGIVYGDLGTSPLYAMQTILQSSGGDVSRASVLGVLSLIVWALLLTVSLKYSAFVLKADNHGEGGILALTALVTGTRPGHVPEGRRAFLMIGIGLFGAALLYGDGILTPSISVLSAIEGVKVATPALSRFVMPVSAGILLALFVSQRFGVSRIGTVFGPVMLLWFLTIGALGALALARHPEVVAAIDPRFGLRFLAAHGWKSLMVLGGVFLALTGAEALYADLGSVGRRPIRLSWYGIVLPALLLCYAGQSAMLLGQKTLPGSAFFNLLPQGVAGWAIWPLVLLATMATIIASQAIITGVFSMTRQAMQLGWFPGLNIRQTSDTEYGEIYVPVLNWILMGCTLALTASFGSSDRLAGAYGMAVSTTMLMTTTLLFSFLHRQAGWPLGAVVAVAGAFLLIDTVFFAANLLKLLEGGYIPLLAGLFVFLIMTTWRRGNAALRTRAKARTLSPERFLSRLAEHRVPRVPGTLVMLSRSGEPVPPLLVTHMEQFGAVQEAVVTVTVQFEQRPRVPQAERVTLRRFEAGLWHVVVRFGFVEIPNLPAALQLARAQGCPIVPDDALYEGSRDEVVRASPGERVLSGWRRMLFGLLYRNAVHAVDRFGLPPQRYVEISRQITV